MTSNDIVPGTVHLVDLQGILNVQKDSNQKRNIILVPQPTSNPNDPLRWSQGKKKAQFAFLFIWSFLQAVNVAWYAPAWTLWTEELTGATFPTLNNATALCFLFLGIGCLFLQPTALKLGRRFVYILCSILAIIANIIGSRAKSIKYIYAAQIIAGFAAAPVDSLVEISTTDVFFQHERAQYLSFFILALYAGSDLGPVACGFLVETMDWRWAYYLLIIFFAVTLIIQLFYMEDTTFERIESDNLQETIVRQIKSHETMLSSTGIEDQIKGSSTDKNISEVAASEIDSALVDESIPERTYWQRMRLIESEYNDSRTWFTIWHRPFVLISFPAVIYGGYVYGSQMMWLALLQTTQSQLYGAPPYNFRSLIVGLTNISALIGSIFGMFYGGRFVDYLTIRLSERNNGILEPEFRLWAMVLPTILNAAGLLAYGLGTGYGVHWFIPVGIGQFCVGFANGSSGGITLTYVIDCYPKLASEALVLMLFIRNVFGMGFCFAIQPWIKTDGLKLTSWLMFMLSLIFNGSFLVFIKWGKNFRRWTTERYYKYSDPKNSKLY